MLINGLNNGDIYIQSSNIDQVTREWEIEFHIELWGHFGLNPADVRIYGAKWGVGLGFTAWWALQHRQGYRPFKTKLEFLVTLSGDYVP